MSVIVSYTRTELNSDFQLNTFEPGGGGNSHPDLLGLPNGDYLYTYWAPYDGLNFAGVTAIEWQNKFDHQLTFTDLSPGSVGGYATSVDRLANGQIIVVWEAGDSIPRGQLFDIQTFGQIHDGATFTLTDIHVASFQAAALANGGFVVAYATGSDVYEEKVSDTGVVLDRKPANAVPPPADHGRFEPAVAALTDGGYVVSYTDNISGSADIHAVIYNADGSVRNTDVAIDVASQSGQTHSKVVGLPNGNFAIVYADSFWGNGGVTLSVWSPTGTNVTAGSFVQVNTTAAPFANGVGFPDPNLAVLPNGFIVVTWMEPSTANDYDVLGRVFDSNGVPVTMNGVSGQFAVDFDDFNAMNPAVSRLTGGKYIMAWDDYQPDTQGGRISATIAEITRSIVGNSGDDFVVGDQLRESFSSGQGVDLFVYKHGGNADVWSDFTPGSGIDDRIDITDFTNIRNLSQLLAASFQASGNTLLDFGNGDTVLLTGVARASLTANDFIFAPPAKDFDGNHRSEILWRHDNGTVSEWDNGAIGGAHVVAGAGVVATSWHIVGTGDFDDNNKLDILWQNDNGTVSIWDNGAIGGARVIANAGVVPASWHIVGVGDFDANGKSDILWQNDNGTVSIWDNGAIGRAHVIAAAGVVPLSWHVAGVGDFNGDSHSDILWRNDNGATSVWNDGQIAKARVLSNAGQVSTAWHVSGVGDFNNNGIDDILWRHDDSTVSVWDDGAIGGAHVIAASGVVPNAWHISNVADYNGDGISDILWRHDNGAVSIWDSGAIGGAHVIAAAGVVASDWHIA